MSTLTPGLQANTPSRTHIQSENVGILELPPEILERILVQAVSDSEWSPNCSDSQLTYCQCERIDGIDGTTPASRVTTRVDADVQNSIHQSASALLETGAVNRPEETRVHAVGCELARKLNKHNVALPCAAWVYLAPVCRKFRHTLQKAATKVVLGDCYEVPSLEWSLQPSNLQEGLNSGRSFRSSLSDFAEDRYARVDYHAPAMLLQGPLMSCPRLDDLDISGCDVLSDEEVVSFALQETCKLRRLSIRVCNQQTDRSVINLARTSREALREVELSGCDRHRHGAMSPSVSRASRHVPCQALTSRSLAALSEYCRNLSQITISNAPSIDNDGIASLATLPKLRDVTLQRVPAVTDTGIERLAAGEARLAKLSLLSNTTLSDSAILALTTGKATKDSLIVFALTFNYSVTDNGIATLVGRLKTLRDIQVDHCSLVSDKWTSAVAAGGGLSRVSLRAVGLELTCPGLAGLAGGSPRMSSLRALNLGFVASVNASALTTLLAAVPQLSVLVLDACSNVDDDAVRVLGRFPKLTSLDLSWCGKLTLDGVMHLCRSNLARTLRRLSIGPVAEPGSVAQDDAESFGEEGVENVGHGVNLEDDGSDAEDLDDNNMYSDAMLAQQMDAAASTMSGLALPMPALDLGPGAQEDAVSEPALQLPAGAIEIPQCPVETSPSSDFIHTDERVDNEARARATPIAAGTDGRAVDSPRGNCSSQYGESVSVIPTPLENDPDLCRRGAALDLALYKIGATCTSLCDLVLCGSVDPATIDWLRKHSRARIDSMEAGISSSLYHAPSALL